MSERLGTTPHQHAILLHQIAEHIRYSGSPETMSKSELIEVVDGLRGWMAGNAVRLLDDSRALNQAAGADRAAAGEGDENVNPVG